MSASNAARLVRATTLVCLVIALFAVFVRRADARRQVGEAHRVEDKTARGGGVRSKALVSPLVLESARGPLFAFPPSPSARSPLTVVYLHGIHGKPENGCPHFRHGATELGWLVCPRANAAAVELPGAFSWGGSTFDKRAVIEDAVRATKADARPPVLVGFSQGAFVATEIVEARAMRVRGLVLMSAEVEPSAASLVAAGAERVVLASGDLDGARTAMLRTAARLQREGIDARFVSIGRVGHMYVPESDADAAALAEAIRWAGGRSQEDAKTRSRG